MALLLLISFPTQCKELSGVDLNLAASIREFLGGGQNHDPGALGAIHITRSLCLLGGLLIKCGLKGPHWELNSHLCGGLIQIRTMERVCVCLQYSSS